MNSTDQPAALKLIDKFRELLAAYDCTEVRVAPAPDSEGWIPWHGGECPVPRDTMVDVQWRDGLASTRASLAGNVRWVHLGNNADVLLYRPAKPDSPQVEPKWAAERAHFEKGGKVEYRHCHCVQGEKRWSSWLLVDQLAWITDSPGYEFRIAPIPERLPDVPWTRETCPPLPFEIRTRSGQRYSVLSLDNFGAYYTVGHSIFYVAYQTMVTAFTMFDGSPCGQPASRAEKGEK